jgi:outer membrane protein assembly factor BamB
VFISPTVVGDNVAIGSCAGTFYALHRTNGTPAWLYDTKADGKAAQFHGELLLIGDTIVVPSDTDGDGHLYCFNAKTGDVQWKVPFKHGVGTTPLLVSGRIVVVSAEGEVAAIDPKTGHVEWKVSPAGQLQSLTYLASPATALGHIVVADNVGKVFALDGSNGKTIWSASLAAHANTSFVLIGGTIVIGTSDRFLNWIDAGSGAIARRVRLAALPYGTLISSPPFLFVLVQGTTSKLLALDAKSGAVRWEQETAKEWTTYRPLVTGSVVIVGTEDKDLCAFNRSDGTRRWCRPVGQIPRGLGVSAAGDTLYVGSLSGKVQVYRISKSDVE